MSLLVDTTSLVQPTLTSLHDLKAASTVYKQATASNDLLVDNTSGIDSDLVGSYTSQPQTLTLHSASDSVLSASKTVSTQSTSSGNSGSLEASSSGVSSGANNKLAVLMSGFLFVSFIVGSI